LETELLVEHIKQLLRGEAADMPVYDFSEHRRTAETIRVEPCPVIFVEGILVFTHPQLRALMDIKIYVDADADVRFIRRLQRDMVERGRGVDSIIHQYLETVRPMHLQFVEPSKRYADVIIPIGGMNKIAVGMVASRLRELLAD
jgi:uridine kinase